MSVRLPVCHAQLLIHELVFKAPVSEQGQNSKHSDFSSGNLFVIGEEDEEDEEIRIVKRVEDYYPETKFSEG